MKKKYIAILLGITLGMTTLVGCSGTNTSESSTIQESQSVTGATENSDKRVSEAETADVYGEVTAVSEDSITIKVGTMKQMEKPDYAGAPGDSSNAQSSDDKTDSDSTEKGSENTDSSENKSDNSSDSRNAQLPENIEKPDGDGQGAPSMLDLTDEEKEIKITDDTVQVSVGDWVDIQLEQQAQSTDGIVLSKAFVRTEDGVSYVYKDDNGVLKKQIVKVKENVNGGAYVLVSGGLSMDDKIAFPYSKSIKEGMKTKEGSLDTFMGYDSTSYGGLG